MTEQATARVDGAGQGMGFICGVLLMYMGEDDAPWADFT